MSVDSALKALEMFAKIRRPDAGLQHNHLHLHAEVLSRGEAIEAAGECLDVFAPYLLAAGAATVTNQVGCLDVVDETCKEAERPHFEDGKT